jgi:DNA-binding NtrC family response regulator
MNATPDTHDYSILITDDDGGCRETLREIVEPKGFRILLASCGEEAVDIVRADPIHLVLLDMHMPTLTGLETLRLVRQINGMLPCILVTGDADQNLMRQAYQAQVYSVIPKPINRHEVLYTILRALERYYGLRDSGR